MKLLVLDLDGTTLDERGQLDPRDIAAAHALRRGGVHVTIATGRLFTGTRWVAEAFGVTGSVAVMNGSELVDVETARATHGRYIDPVARSHAREVLQEHGLPAFLFGSRRIHLDHRDSEHANYLGTWTRDLTHHDDVFTADAWHAEDLLALGAVGDPERIAAARDDLHAELPDEHGSVVFRTYTGRSFLSLRHHGEDKGTAVERLAAERGATAEETVVVGDWHNDVPMLRRAGRSFVMGGAIPEVTEHADEILDVQRGQAGAVAEVARRVWGIQDER